MSSHALLAKIVVLENRIFLYLKNRIAVPIVGSLNKNQPFVFEDSITGVLIL